MQNQPNNNIARINSKQYIRYSPSQREQYHSPIIRHTYQKSKNSNYFSKKIDQSLNQSNQTETDNILSILVNLFKTQLSQDLNQYQLEKAISTLIHDNINLLKSNNHYKQLSSNLNEQINLLLSNIQIYLEILQEANIFFPKKIEYLNTINKIKTSLLEIDQEQVFTIIDLLEGIKIKESEQVPITKKQRVSFLLSNNTQKKLEFLDNHSYEQLNEIKKIQEDLTILVKEREQARKQKIEEKKIINEDSEISQDDESQNSQLQLYEEMLEEKDAIIEQQNRIISFYFKSIQNLSNINFQHYKDWSLEIESNNNNSLIEGFSIKYNQKLTDFELYDGQCALISFKWDLLSELIKYFDSQLLVKKNITANLTFEKKSKLPYLLFSMLLNPTQTNTVQSIGQNYEGQRLWDEFWIQFFQKGMIIMICDEISFIEYQFIKYLHRIRDVGQNPIVIIGNINQLQIKQDWTLIQKDRYKEQLQGLVSEYVSQQPQYLSFNKELSKFIESKSSMFCQQGNLILKGNIVKGSANLIWRQKRLSSFYFSDSFEVNINFQQNSIIIKKNAQYEVRDLIFNENNLKIIIEYFEDKFNRIIFIENQKFEFHENPKIIAYNQEQVLQY